ncbi:hypothetical protein FACS1894176_03710 [Bacteroidia bacterium]|nr:hypothetical protein FACS1894176_03710 [Bacteroidia bacterium]
MTKKRTIHLLAIIAMITIVCFGYASADDLTTTGDNVGLMALSIHFWLSILSRIWIIFAKIAGELLTNARIYGSGIGLDSYLRLCWNMVKNIANFVL